MSRDNAYRVLWSTWKQVTGRDIGDQDDDLDTSVQGIVSSASKSVFNTTVKPHGKGLHYGQRCIACYGYGT